MGEQEQNLDTNILLPKADVHFHTQDESVAEAVALLRADWRFKRVNIIHEKGKLDTAIGYYSEYEAPGLLVVETDSIDDGFMEQLDELAGNLDEGTAAIIIGPVNDVYVYRKLIAMGVSDYLVRPVDKNVLSDVIAKTLVERIGVSNSKLVAVTGTKGGTGVSTLSQALAYTLSDIEQQKTLMMDASGGWSYLSVAMGQEPSATLMEAARYAVSNNQEDLNRVQVPVDDYLSILSVGGDSLYDDPVTAPDFEALINHLMAHYPYVVVDLSGAPSHLARTALLRANEIFVVATPTLPSLRQARTLIKEIDDLRSGEHDGAVKFVLNAQGQDKASEVSASDIETALETKIDLSIAYDPKLFRATESQGKVLKDIKGTEKLTNSLSALLQDILDKDDKASTSKAKSDSSLVGGLLNKIKG